MSTLKVNNIVDAAGTGSPTFSNGLSSSNIKGRVDGVAVAAGYVGEKIASTVSANTTSTGTGTPLSEVDVTGASITLTAGVWKIFYSASVNGTAIVTTNATTKARLRVTTSANVHVAGSNTFSTTNQSSANANSTEVRSHTCTIPVSIASTTTYKLRLQSYHPDGGTTTVYGAASQTLGFTDVDTEVQFYAVRIA